MALKYVVNNPLVFLNPTTDTPSTPSGTTGGTDVSKFFKKVSFKLARVEVDVAGFGDLGDASEKGSDTHSMMVDMFQSADFALFTGLLITELRSNADTLILFKDDSGAFTDARPGILVRVKVCGIGELFGAKNAAGGGSETWKIQGQACILKASTAILV